MSTTTSSNNNDSYARRNCSRRWWMKCSIGACVLRTNGHDKRRQRSYRAKRR